jgi:hypothetical protein
MSTTRTSGELSFSQALMRPHARNARARYGPEMSAYSSAQAPYAALSDCEEEGPAATVAAG